MVNINDVHLINKLGLRFFRNTVEGIVTPSLFYEDELPTSDHRMLIRGPLSSIIHKDIHSFSTSASEGSVKLRITEGLVAMCCSTFCC